MSSGFSEIDGRALRSLFEDVAGDTVVQLDRKGFLIHAPHNLARIWPALSGMLVLPHLSDLARSCHREAVKAYVAAAISAEGPRRPLEFPLALSGAPEEGDAPPWCALSIRSIDGGAGVAGVALGLLRKVAAPGHAQSAGGHPKLDPVSGLPDRHTLIQVMQDSLARDRSATLAVFAIDRIDALRIQYGEQAANEITWGFARFIEAMAMPGCEIGQLDRERVGVILPVSTSRDAQQWARDAIDTFSALVLPNGSTKLGLTTSAGLAALEKSVDHAMRQAEIGLVMARAAGGARIGRSGYCAPAACGSAVAMIHGIAPYLRDDALGRAAVAR